MSLVLILANERERCGEHDPAFLLDARGETLGIRGVPHGNHVAFAAIGECASFEREARASAAHFDFDQIAALDILRLLDLECGDRGRGFDGLRGNFPMTLSSASGTSWLEGGASYSSTRTWRPSIGRPVGRSSVATIRIERTRILARAQIANRRSPPYCTTPRHSSGTSAFSKEGAAGKVDRSKLTWPRGTG